MKKIKERINNLIDNVSPVKFFVITALLFGPVLVFINPPFQSPDEQIHFFRAYHVSQPSLTLDKTQAGAGGYLPKSLENVVRATFVHPASPDYVETKYDTHKTTKALSIKTEPKVAKFYDLSATGLNPPTSYLPQAVGISVAKIFNAPPIAMMYLGRLFNMIAWVCVCALAIHLIPRKKWVVVFLGLLPMTLFQAASLSADVVAIGSMLLFFAYVLNLRETQRKLSRKQLAVLLTIAIFMALSKQSMVIFLPLVLLLPDKLFARRRLAYITKGLLITIPLVFWAGWLLLNKDLSQVPAFSNDAIPRDQLKFIILHPYSFVNVLWNTYFFSWGDTVTRSFIGSFGWVNVPLSEVIVWFGYLSMALLMLVSDNTAKLRAWLSGRQKLLVGSIALTYWAAVNAALYIFNSPVGYKIIVGLQGRYFLPVAVLLVPILYGDWLKTTKSVYRRIAIFAPVILLSASTITIYVRYYINNV